MATSTPESLKQMFCDAVDIAVDTCKGLGLHDNTSQTFCAVEAVIYLAKKLEHDVREASANKTN